MTRSSAPSAPWAAASARSSWRAWRSSCRPLVCSREEAGRQGVVLPREVKMDAYFQPRVVLEVKAASVSQSPLYHGVSLRFPRFLRFREDKQAKDVTSLEDL